MLYKITSIKRTFIHKFYGRQSGSLKHHLESGNGLIKLISVSLLIYSLSLTLGPAVAATQLLSGPESIVYDSAHQRYLVSNMNYPYYITAIDKDGTYSIFYSGLDWPHGMTIRENILYVTSNIGSQGGIVGIDLDTGTKVFEHKSASWYNAIYSNLTQDTSGNMYFGVYNTIYRYNFEEGQHYLVQTGFNIPNGIHFDKNNNRVLIPCEIWQSDLFAIDAADYSLSSIPVPYGRYSCITEDQINNFYVSCFWENEVYRFDSNLAYRELIASGLSGPEAIYFNKLHSTLAIPNLSANIIDLDPIDIDLWCTQSSVTGWAPQTIEFAGESIFEIAEWLWDFGDGSTSNEPTPSHTFETPGLFDVTMQAVTADGNILRRVYPNYIFNLADSIWAETVELTETNDFMMTINVKSNVPLAEMIIPIDYSGTLNIVLDSFSTMGCFSEPFEANSILDEDIDLKHITLHFKPRSHNWPYYFPPISGAVAKLYFHPVNPAKEEQAIIDFSGYSAEFIPLFIANRNEYNPITRNGMVAVLYKCGDANDDSNIDILDIVFIINYLYKSGSAPDPLESADVNGDTELNILDIVYLINYLYKGGLAPDCP